MKKLARILVPVLLTLLLLEVGLRLLRPHSDTLRTLLYSSVDRTDNERFESLESLMESTIVGFRPGTMRAGYRRNSRSFRTREYTGPKPPGSWRVMALGDSFTDASGGVPFEDMWTSEMERQLAAISSCPIEVFGLGVPGVGPEFEFRLWEIEHHRVRADLVVVALFVGNDFGPLRPWLVRAPLKVSMLYRLIRNLSTLTRNRQRRGSPASDPKRPALRRSFEPQAYLEIEAERFKLVLRRHEREALGLCQQVGDLLVEFHRAVERSGSSFAVMLIPDEFQVDSELLGALESYLGVTAAAVDLEFPQRCLGERLAAHEIAYLDLLPAFRSTTESQRLYWPRNTHWNVEGNRLAGRLLADFLVRRNLVPAIDPNRGVSLD